MSDHDFDPDELVSAYLDGEATAEEIARIDASPELQERLAQLRAVAARVAAPVPPPPEGHRDAAVAAALAVSSTAANVTSLTTRRRWSTQSLRIASAAAVVALFMLAGAIVFLNFDRDDDVDTVASEDAATSAELDAAAAPEAAEGRAEAPAAEEPADEPADEPAEAMAEPPVEETAEEPADESLADDGDEPLGDDSAGGDADAVAPPPPLSDDDAELLRGLEVEVADQPDVGSLAVAVLDAVDAGPIDAPDDGDDRELFPVCLGAAVEQFDAAEIIGYATADVGDTATTAVALVWPDGRRSVAVFESGSCALIDDISP